MEIIGACERTVLQPIDHAVLFAALDNSAAPTDKLRAALLVTRRRSPSDDGSDAAQQHQREAGDYMSEATFNKIAAGLEDAIAFACGDKTKVRSRYQSP